MTNRDGTASDRPENMEGLLERIKGIDFDVLTNQLFAAGVQSLLEAMEYRKMNPGGLAAVSPDELTDRILELMCEMPWDHDLHPLLDFMDCATVVPREVLVRQIGWLMGGALVSMGMRRGLSPEGLDPKRGAEMLGEAIGGPNPVAGL